MVTSEVEIILAFVFNRSGKNELNISDLYLILSMDLKWFSPKSGRDFISSAIHQKLLQKKGEAVKPNFDYRKVNIPVGFHPSKKPIEKKEDSVKNEQVDFLKIIINKILEKTNQKRTELENKIMTLSKEKDVTPEVAALLISKEYEIKILECFDDVESGIFRESTK